MEMEILGIDVGGSGVKGAPVDCDNGELLAERFRLATPARSTPEAVAKTIRQIADHFAWHGPIGCGLPSVVKNGVVHTAANIDARWIGTDAHALIELATGCPVRAINDADAAGLAEMRFGAGRGHDGVVLMVTLGTGIGTALFVDGQLLPNTELGHIEIDGHEAEKRAADSARQRKKLSWKSWAKRVDRYLCEMQKLFWPDLIIIGGGASKTSKRFLPLLSVKAQVVPAQLLNEAGIIGAALWGSTVMPLEMMSLERGVGAD
jgi:polyphosphate glucokinase